MNFKARYFILPVFILIGAFSCSNDDSGDGLNDSFDRQGMLTGLADEIIIPSFEAYVVQLDGFHSAVQRFNTDANLTNLADLRSAYLNAYLAWQSVSMFDIGKAEEIKLRNYSNIFPTDVGLIESNIEAQIYNLELPSNYVAQGFPALDYLLYGVAENDESILTILSQVDYSTYLTDLIERLQLLGNTVLADWQGDYRERFINNSGSSATASVDKLVNDFLFYYEKFLRAGKIGIPAGVFTGNVISNSVEAPFSSIYSKELFNEGFDAVQNFFRGASFDQSKTVNSLEQYLQHIQEANQTDDIASNIISQWAEAETKIDVLSNSFKDQIENDNITMLSAYDELQKAVVLLKVDMLSALNIQVDFVDADGD